MSRLVGTLCAIISVMDDVRIYFPKIEPPSDEEWQRLQPLLEKAKAEGNPWAFASGIF